MYLVWQIDQTKRRKNNGIKKTENDGKKMWLPDIGTRSLTVSALRIR